MKKATALLSTATIVGILASSIPAFAEQVVDGRTGQTTGDVTVNGIIGEFDNTTPGPNPELTDDWINVTIPTTALFYTTASSNHEEIVSPTYTITNNSAVGVTTYVSGVDTPTGMSEIDLLEVNGIELFENGAPTVSETELFTLQGNQGSTTVGSFSFTGDASLSNAATELNPSFNLVLRFAPVI